MTVGRVRGENVDNFPGQVRKGRREDAKASALPSDVKFVREKVISAFIRRRVTVIALRDVVHLLLFPRNIFVFFVVVVVVIVGVTFVRT